MLDNFNEVYQSTNPAADIKKAKMPGVFVVNTPADRRTHLVLATQISKPLTVISWDQDGETHNTLSLPNTPATITRIDDAPLREYLQATHEKASGAAR